MASSIIEVGIGLILVYLLMSLLVSQINNILKNVLNVRSHYVEQELKRLLDDPEIRARVLAHPSVGLAEGVTEGDVLKNLSAKKLTEVLIDVLAGTGEALEKLEQLTNSPLVIELLNSVQNPTMRQKLQDVLQTARNLGDARRRLEEWFDAGMTRAQELFTRRLQFFSLLVGAILAILLNVDTLYIGQTLWNDPVLRQATVDAANVAAEEIQAAVGTEVEGLEESVAVAQETVNDLLELRLPVGWYYQAVDDAADAGTILNMRQDTRNLWNLLPGNNPDWLGLLVQKIIGLILTTIAVMQGAPFWFDLLRRATGK
jgi:hypothetical protein